MSEVYQWTDLQLVNDHISNLTAENAALRERVEWFRNHFETFAAHTPICRGVTPYFYTCDCGLNELREQMAAEDIVNEVKNES